MNLLILALLLTKASAAPQELLGDGNDKDIEEASGDSDIDLGFKSFLDLDESRVLIAASTEPSESKSDDVEIDELVSFESSDDPIITEDIVDEELNTKEYPEELYLPDEDAIANEIDDSLGSDDIIDVIENFIAEEDPILQVLLNDNL